MTRSDVYCTNCGGSFIAELDLSLNGNHQITCPLCQHVHYRVVQDGIVTEDRWASSAGPTYVVTVSTTVTLSTAWSTTYSATTIYPSWLDRSDLNLVSGGGGGGAGTTQAPPVQAATMMERARARLTRLLRTVP